MGINKEALSKLYNLNGTFKKAEKMLFGAIEIRFDKEYYYELANIYEHEGNLKEALRVLRIVESGVPTLIIPKYRIAVLYLKLKDISNFRIKAKEVISFKLKVGNSYSLGLQKKMKYLLENNSHITNRF